MAKTWFVVKWGAASCAIEGPFGGDKDSARKYARDELFEMQGPDEHEAIGIFPVELEEVSLWSRLPGEHTMAFRLTDGQGKTYHGTVVAANKDEAQQRVMAAAAEHDLPAGDGEPEVVILGAYPRVTFIEDNNSFGV